MRYLVSLLVLLTLSCGSVPEPLPIQDGPDWTALFPEADVRDPADSCCDQDPGVEVIEPQMTIIATCTGGTQAVTGLIEYEGAPLPESAAVYVLLDEDSNPTGIPGCFGGEKSPVFPIGFELSQVRADKPFYVMALIDMEEQLGHCLLMTLI